MEHFDIGLVGYWYATNYGSILTYYALGLALNKMGYSTVLIDRPEKERDPEGEDVISRNFLKSHCNISESVKWDKLEGLSDLCDSFIIGSDQVWTASAIKYFKYMFFLSFVDDNKKKIAYAPSFGSVNFFNINAEQEIQVKNCLSKFDKISIREVSGVDFLKNRFGIKADRVLDPVFLISQKDYDDIAAESDINTNEKYILAYILDPTPDKEKFIKTVSEKMNVGVKIILDGRKGTFPKNREKFEYYDDENILSDVNEADWVKLFKDSEYVLTDSHHGVAMAIIYNKNYICYANRSRGYERFTSLLTLLGMMDRMIDNCEQVTENLINVPVDYSAVNEKLKYERERSLKWLNDGLISKKEPLREPDNNETKITNTAGENAANKHLEKNPDRKDPDLERCRMLASLMRDYKIKHIVLSSGTRHVNLVRFFEGNSCFKTYNVVDERSAGFFAVGLALKLKETVAICCTSGTAASNYISPVTEAYYQNIPLLVITADRYPCLLNQQEQQMVPQMNIFNGIVKKSVQLPVANTPLGKWETRRMICDCLLEINHHGSGPVHIDVPINNIIRKSLGEESVRLSKYRNIYRIPYLPDRSYWNRSVERLKESHRIMIFWGQSAPLSKDDLNAVNKFANRFDCVICTDYLSNLHCDKSIHIYNMIGAISKNDAAVKELAPDIFITVGGNNIATTGGLVARSANCEHWNILPDGRVSDPYRKLYRVFECTTMQFIKRINFMTEGFASSDSYYQSWIKYKHDNKLPSEYNQSYATGKTIMGIPDGSDLHLANSNTVRIANSYDLKESVTVYCNRGTNGIDGSVSSFMGMCAASDKLCFMLTGDLAFFYDLNSLWNKKLNGNIRIMLFNNSGTSLLRDHGCNAITYQHEAVAEGWVKSLGFKYLSSRNKEEFDRDLPEFLAEDSDRAVFFEVFC